MLSSVAGLSLHSSDLPSGVHTLPHSWLLCAGDLAEPTARPPQLSLRNHWGWACLSARLSHHWTASRGGHAMSPLPQRQSGRRALYVTVLPKYRFLHVVVMKLRKPLIPETHLSLLKKS